MENILLMSEEDQDPGRGLKVEEVGKLALDRVDSRTDGRTNERTKERTK